MRSRTTTRHVHSRWQPPVSARSSERPKTVQFEKPVVIEGEVVQPVRMTDVEGRAWVALYPMQRQADGGWRINGCQLARLPGREV